MRTINAGEVYSKSTVKLDEDTLIKHAKPPVDPSADLNGDGIVNHDDLLILQNQWGQYGKKLSADLNGDGIVNAYDAFILMDQYGQTFNIAPVAVDDHFTITDSSEMFSILMDAEQNDYDPNGHSFGITSVDSITIDYGDGIEQILDLDIVTFSGGTFDTFWINTPDLGCVDAEITIEYTITDILGLTDTATITIDYDANCDDLDVVNDEATVLLAFCGTSEGVMGNVFDNDGTVAMVTSITFAGQTLLVPTDDSIEIEGHSGMLTINADGSYIYVPNSGTGEDVDSFSYTVSNGGVEVTAILTITLEYNTPVEGEVIYSDEQNIYGTDGNDEVHSTNTDPTLYHLISTGDGDDVVYINIGDSKVYTGCGNDIVHGGENNDGIHGNDGNDLLYGNGGNDTIFGNDGNDTAYGGQGDDYLRGNDGHDILHGDAGEDTFRGGDGDDTIYGGADDDTIYGGNDSDQLYGGDGNDYLRGNDGSDTLIGGGGSDTFVWNSMDLDDLVDNILDFSVSEGDALSIGVFAYDEVTDAIADFIIFTDNGTDSTLSVDIDGAGTEHGFVDVAIIYGGAGLNAEDLEDSGNLIV